MTDVTTEDEERHAQVTRLMASIDRNQRGIDVELAMLVLKASLPKAVWSRLKRRRHLIVVLEVPSVQWIQAVERAARRAFEPIVIYGYDGSSKSQRPDVDLSQVALKVQSSAVIGVSHAPNQYMPRTMVAAADCYCRIGLPSGDMIRNVMRVFAKRPVPRYLCFGVEF